MSVLTTTPDGTVVLPIDPTILRVLGWHPGDVVTQDLEMSHDEGQALIVTKPNVATKDAA